MSIKDQENGMVFFVNHSAEPLGEEYRLRRCLALAKRLGKPRKVYFLAPTALKESVEAGGGVYVDAGFDDLDSLARFLEDFAPRVAVFDVDAVPLALVLLLRGLNSLIISLDGQPEAEKYTDIFINTHLPGGNADFFGLKYWVPENGWLWELESAESGQSVEAPGSSNIVFHVPSSQGCLAGPLEEICERLRRRGYSVRTVSSDDRGAGTGDVRQAVEEAALIVNVGLERLFDLMSLSKAVACLTLNHGESELINTLLPEGGVFDLGIPEENRGKEICEHIEQILSQREVLEYHAALSGSIVSQNNLDTVCDIINIVKLLDWDTNFFGFPVAFLSCLKLNHNITRFVFDFCRRHSVRLLEYQCDCHDRESVLLAEKTGFNFADIRLTFERFIDPRIQVPDMPSDVTLTIGEEGDIGRLKEIADGLYLSSRYFFDLNFPRDKVRRFYQDWVRKAVHGTFDDQAYVLRLNGDPAGFCTVKFEPVSCARIRLVGLEPRYRGRRLGPIMVMHTLKALAEKGIKYVQVVTQGRNYAAQRLYQKSGFVTKKTELWYHRWFNEEEAFHF